MQFVDTDALIFPAGVIQLRNWKPLSLAAITDSGTATVQEVLGDLSSVATLRIKLGGR